MTQKKLSYYSLLLLLVAGIINAACGPACSCAHTAFVPRKFSQNSMLELGLQNYDLLNYYPRYEYEQCSWFILQASGFYFQSTNNDEQAQYFLPGCQNCITVQQNNTSDVSSAWLGLLRPVDDPFSSKFCIEPKRTVGGGAIKLYFDLQSWFGDCSCWYKNWWASIFIPIVHVKHNLNNEELLSSGPGTAPGGFTTVQAALNNPAWRYGKFPCKARTKTGVDDINIKIGLNVIENNCGHAGLYGIIFAPTGKGTKACSVFEPLVGGNHVGLGAGLNTDYRFYANEVCSLDLMADIRYAYFLKHRETRSFDLFNGDWSRYLLVVTPDDVNNPVPGINFLTQSADVTPRGNLDIWIALHYQKCNWDFELGYDFWWRQKEKIDLVCACPDVGIFDIAGCPRTTSSTAKICQAIRGEADAPISDAVFTPIRCTCAAGDQSSVVNVDSAASPVAISNTIYAAVARHFMVCNDPAMLGIGGSYEFAARDSALSQYGIWVKGSITF